MKSCPYTLDEDDPATPPLGLVALKADETIEGEVARCFADMANKVFVTRVHSAPDVTTDTLAQMQRDLPAAVALLPDTRKYSVIGYGCTSGSAVIGSETVASIIKNACNTDHVTDPLRATVACAASQVVSKIALLSPYTETVNTGLIAAFAEQGLSTDVFGTFDVKEEAKVARISARSLIENATMLGTDPSVEAVFISCTNLRTFDVLKQISDVIGKPAMSSNQTLFWHMRSLATSVGQSAQLKA